jgi:transposase-like protein
MSDTAEGTTPEDSGRQRKQAAGVAALALATGKTVREAARKAGIGETTLYKWLRKPAFKARVTELRERMVAEAVGKLSRGMAGAAATLERLLKSKDERVKLAAAKAILDSAVKVRDQADLADRLAAVEAALKGGN